MSKLRWPNLLSVSLLASLAVACQAKSSAPADAPVAAITNRQYYQAKGVVKELDVGSRGMVIQHEAVPGYMPAMTMPFRSAGYKRNARTAGGGHGFLSPGHCRQ